jgi:acyl-CoA thioester hydrolase
MLEITQLDDLPKLETITIPEDYLDEMGHMNIMYYIHIFDRTIWNLFSKFGLTFEYTKQKQKGMFALKQFIQYWAEVHTGETVHVRARVLDVGEKRVHFMAFMVNETTQKIASTFEVLASFADLTTRRTAPFPPEVKARIQATVDRNRQLTWDAPTCGILKV